MLHYLGCLFFFIVVNLSFYRTTEILLDASIVVSCRIMYFKICIVGQQSFYLNMFDYLIKIHFVNKILLRSFKFPNKCLGFRLELVDEFTKIVPSAFGPFIGYHQGSLACIKSVFKELLKEFFLGFL